MKKFQFIWDEMFHSNIYWFRGNRKDYEKLVKKMFDLQAPRRAPRVVGTFEIYYAKGQPVGVIWLRNQSILALAHECFHATHWSLGRNGTTLSDDSEEIYAYYQQYLIKKIRRRK